MPNPTTLTDGTQDPATPVNEVMLVDMLQNIDQEISDLKARIDDLEKALGMKDEQHANDMAGMHTKMDTMSQAHDQKFAQFTGNLQKTIYGA